MILPSVYYTDKPLLSTLSSGGWENGGPGWRQQLPHTAGRGSRASAWRSASNCRVELRDQECSFSRDGCALLEPPGSRSQNEMYVLYIYHDPKQTCPCINALCQLAVRHDAFPKLY